VGPEQAARLKPVDWQSAPVKVWLPLWEKAVGGYTAALKGVTAASLPDFLKSPGELAAQIQRSAGRPLAGDERAGAAARISAMALAVALARQGWTCDTSPGAQVSLHQNENRIEPFVTAVQLASGELPADAWQALCDQVGIAGVPLAAAG